MGLALWFYVCKLFIDNESEKIGCTLVCANIVRFST